MTTQAAPGYVYVMRSPATAEGLCKIGLTQGDGTGLDPLHRRAKEVSSATGAPGRYTVVRYRHFTDCMAAERQIHNLLLEYHYYAEFFWLPTVDVVEEAFDYVEEHPTAHVEASRLNRMIDRNGGMLWAGDLEVSRPKRAHLDYVQGRNMMRHSPERGERFLLRAAGLLLPSELSEGVKVVQALRWLGIFHSAGRMYAPYSKSGEWPAQPTVEALGYMRSAEAVRYFTMAGGSGDYVSWGLLGQHLIALDDFQGASIAFASFTRGLASALERTRFLESSNLQSPTGSGDVGRRYDVLQTVSGILAAATDYVVVNKLLPFPSDARAILTPLFERSLYVRLPGNEWELYRRALQGLNYGPEIEYRSLQPRILPKNRKPPESST